MHIYINKTRPDKNIKRCTLLTEILRIEYYAI